MPTECSQDSFAFGTVEGRVVVGAFDGGTITSDAGALLLGQTDKAIGLVSRLAQCFQDGRDPDATIHTLSDISTCETCLDDARVARGIWRLACGRVQVMFPAYLCGAMTAGPDVVRKPGPNQNDGLNTHVSQRVLLADRSTTSHHAIITLAIRD